METNIDFNQNGLSHSGRCFYIEVGIAWTTAVAVLLSSIYLIAAMLFAALLPGIHVPEEHAGSVAAIVRSLLSGSSVVAFGVCTFLVAHLGLWARWKKCLAIAAVGLAVLLGAGCVTRPEAAIGLWMLDGASWLIAMLLVVVAGGILLMSKYERHEVAEVEAEGAEEAVDDEAVDDESAGEVVEPDEGDAAASGCSEQQSCSEQPSGAEGPSEPDAADELVAAEDDPAVSGRLEQQGCSRRQSGDDDADAPEEDAEADGDDGAESDSEDADDEAADSDEDDAAASGCSEQQSRPEQRSDGDDAGESDSEADEYGAAVSDCLEQQGCSRRQSDADAVPDSDAPEVETVEWADFDSQAASAEEPDEVPVANPIARLLSRLLKS